MNKVRGFFGQRASFENSSLVIVLGLCPALIIAVSTINGAGIGLATTLVLVLSNFAMLLMGKWISDRVRMPVYLVVLILITAVLWLLLKGYGYEFYKSFGSYCPFLVVNCIILNPLDVYESKKKLLPSVLESLKQGVGFTLILLSVGFLREFLGTDIVLQEPVRVFAMIPGAFFAAAFVIALCFKIQEKINRKKIAFEFAGSLGTAYPFLTIGCIVSGVIYLFIQNGFQSLENIFVGGVIAALFFLWRISCSKSIKGLPVCLLTAGLITMVFYGFGGFFR